MRLWLRPPDNFGEHYKKIVEYVSKTHENPRNYMYTNALFHKISMYIAESPSVICCPGFVGVSFTMMI
jgi:hypothetical protein